VKTWRPQLKMTIINIIIHIYIAILLTVALNLLKAASILLIPPQTNIKGPLASTGTIIKQNTSQPAKGPFCK
jgi:hypothetical protein